MWQFILFRGLQGLGGGAVFPVALAVVADLYTPAERGKYVGLFGAVFGLSSLLGPGIGGIHHRHVRLALDLLRQRADRRSSRSSSAGGCCRRSSVPRPARNIDYVGAALFTAAIAPFLIGLTQQADAASGPIPGSAA